MYIYVCYTSDSQTWLREILRKIIKYNIAKNAAKMNGLEELAGKVTDKTNAMLFIFHFDLL